VSRVFHHPFLIKILNPDANSRFSFHSGRWAIIKLGLVGPLMQVTRTVGNEVQRQASERLRQHFAQPLLTQPISANRTDNTYDDEMIVDEDGPSLELRKIR